MNVGDALNWLAVAAAFPLMTLPFAARIRPTGSFGALIWALIVYLIAGLGWAFVSLAPRLAQPPAGAVWAVAGGVGALGVMIALAGGPARAAMKLAAPFETIVRAAGKVAMGLVFVMAFVQFLGVLGRYVFGASLLAMQESVIYMHGAVFLLAAGYALLTDDHVRVDIFYREAPPRRKAVTDLIGAYLFLFPFALLILWTSSFYVGQSWAAREGSAEQSGLQALFLLKSLIPIFATLLAMAGFVQATRAVRVLNESPAA